MSPWHRVALVTGGPVFALVKGHDRVSGTHRIALIVGRAGAPGPAGSRPNSPQGRSTGLGRAGPLGPPLLASAAQEEG